jgi:hypothetical protein
MNMMKLMQQAATMQKKIAQMQEEMKTRQFEHSAGGGMVTAIIRGDMTVERIRIDPKAIDPSDPGILEDLVKIAVNGAYQAARDTVSSEMNAITGGMGGGMGLPGL